MVIKYRLDYSKDSDDYAYLVSQILKDSDANVIKTDDEIIIFMQGNEDEIKGYFTLLGEKLPLSLYLGAQHVEEAAFMPKNPQPLKEASYMAMYPTVSREILSDGESGFEFLSEVSSCGASLGSKDEVVSAVRAALDGFLEGKKIAVLYDKKTVVFSNTPSPAALLTNMTERAASRFSLSFDDTLTLGAMERPFLLKLGEDGLKAFFFADNPLSLIVCKEAASMGIDALYIDGGDVFDVALEDKGRMFLPPKKEFVYFCGADRFFVNEDFSQAAQSDKDALFFGALADSSFGMYAKKAGVGSKRLFGASFFDGAVLDGVKKSFDFGGKLAANFEQSFEQISKKLNEIEFEASNDAKNFFSAICVTLSKEGGFCSLAYAANNCDVAGGVKLDMGLSKEGGVAVLDLKKCFASILSYKIAGVEDDVLAYSIFESLVDLIILATDEAKKSFTPSLLEIGGEFLLAKPFTANIKSKIKSIDVDMALNSIPQNLKSLCIVAN